MEARHPSMPDLSMDKRLKHSNENHAVPRQQFANIAATGDSRIHAGNSYVEQQHSYYGPNIAPANPVSTTMSLRTALAFPEMSLRHDNIATAQSQTCEWIFETPEHKRWLDPAFRPAHHGILWIKGKPGAGKSTIMKHILQNAQRTGDTGKVISFFFNARGQGLVRSTEGLYRALLHQIVDDVPSLQGMVNADSRSNYKDNGWPLELLKDLFREAVLHYQYNSSLTCCVDALDECDEDEIRNMLELFEDLGESAGSAELPFLMCFTSRHYPRISIAHAEEIEIDELLGHQEDISQYIQRRLRLLHVGTALREDLAIEITERSSGVFLWVVLVVGILNKTSDQGNIHLFRDRLRKIPTNLRELFDDIVGKEKPDVQFLPIILWMLFAKRPLKAVELYYAVMVSTDTLTEKKIRWDEDLVDERVLCDFVTASSKGFLEPIAFASQSWYRSRSRHQINPSPHLSFQFIHDSVREFFLEYGLQRLDTDLGKDFAEVAENVHQRLASWCLSYLELSLAQHLSAVGSPQAPASRSVLNAQSLDSNTLLEYVLREGACYHSCKDQQRRFINPDGDVICDHLAYNWSLFSENRWKHGFGVYLRYQGEVLTNLHPWIKDAFNYLLGCVLGDSNVNHSYTGRDTANRRKIWDGLHIARIKVIGILISEQGW